MSKRVRILLGGILLALMSAYFVLYLCSISLPKKGSYAGFHAIWEAKGEPHIDGVDPTAFVADFQVGDELIAVDGVKIRDDPRVLIDNDPPPGTRITFTIRRAGQLRDVTVQTIPHRERLQFHPIYYIFLLFLLTAWGVFLLRPDDKQAWMLALMLATLPGLFGGDPDNLPSWLTPIISAARIAGLLFLPFFVHFFLIFPGRSPLLRRWRRLEALLYLPFLFVPLPVFGTDRFGLATVKAWKLQFEWSGYFFNAAVFVLIAYLAAGLGCWIINYRAESLVNRRRLRVVMVGSAGFVHLLVLNAGAQIGLNGQMPALWTWLNTTLYVTLPLMAKEGLLGVISVGAHLGDLPFSSDDKKLLLSVGGPTSFALENIRLIERTIEDERRRRDLEAENEQRARELEEARQLQLSMLPKNVPQLPHLEIAPYMKPAAEVGGDYYDFHLADDGTLTVAVGDATGHGLKAGTVVTAMKSLFRTFAAEPEIVPVFDRSSRVLKEMNLRSLFMGLTMIKLNGRRMRISSAGMPPALIYRAETGSVEEVIIKAMPLGSVTGYAYRERELTLGCGDVVVLMSDGLPERFNRAGEMFDYSRTKESLTEAAALAPREIIERLVDAGEAWADGRPQDDDITFVALKVKL
jgi:serine phosphatase RsbU (regulator of sigma subunit)